MVAVVSRREDGRREELTWEQLAAAVGSCQSWLRSVGVGPGDHVAAWMPNVPETLVAMLATVGLGAVFTSTSPDFGVAGVVDLAGGIVVHATAGTSALVLAAVLGKRRGFPAHLQPPHSPWISAAAG